MTSRKLLPRAALAALLFALPAAADAPTNPPQYDRFDGDSVTINDLFTGLVWDRKGVIKNVSYDIASAGCGFLASLENVGRLPTVKELLTILDEDPHVEYEGGKFVTKMIDQVAFSGTTGGTPVDLPYWTSTPAPMAPTMPGVDMVWTLNFATGAMTPMAKSTGKANARCVR